MNSIDINSITPPGLETLHEDNIWHEFKNRSEKPVFMCNIHPFLEMITEWEGVF